MFRSQETDTRRVVMESMEPRQLLTSMLDFPAPVHTFMRPGIVRALEAHEVRPAAGRATNFFDHIQARLQTRELASERWGDIPEHAIDRFFAAPAGLQRAMFTEWQRTIPHHAAQAGVEPGSPADAGIHVQPGPGTLQMPARLVFERIPRGGEPGGPPTVGDGAPEEPPGRSIQQVVRALFGRSR